MADLLEGEYVLPLRWSEDGDLPELTGYLRRLAGWIPVTVVDGSAPELFAVHGREWAGLVRHLPPEPRPGANGKVAGVVTGVRAARYERVVLADDDVRYDRGALERVLALLDTADVVRPQNVFAPAPWHARWDTGRTLLNRAVAADYPGTFGLRRDTFLAMGGYCGDVLFENLEMVRTLRAAGGREHRANDLFVARRPPSAAHFWSQRRRQAYDDLAQPWRLAGALAVVPFVVSSVLAGRERRVVVAAGAVVGVAEVGRRRAGGRRVFPATAPLWAPLWVLERGICSWLAVLDRLVHGGVRYGKSRLRTAAHSVPALRRTVRRSAPLPLLHPPPTGLSVPNVRRGARTFGTESPDQATGSASP